MPFQPVTIRQAPPPVIMPVWHDCTYIFRRDCGTIFATDAWSFGTLFVHVSLPEEEKVLFVVTHGPSRVAIVRVETIEDATAIAEHLWATCREAVCHPGEPVDKSKIPENMIGWIRECNKQRRYVR